ncbi:tRNA (guanine-N(7)-)-methyltransferase [Mycoplasmopsis californica]|uniref:tRNA (guanine-N(7)-)-methyltransferase n=1 Tax=Mycoplasmopsis equigenitalium TaxID=114883 RepID=A0ABY5J3R4_9BACT|nr:tRNA (guanosine(46)-N7)-methyltransferase TrmB [Mycoplasmopsis equigenitalium]UUD37166.1 tRNA (guanosine(46)-N7)-methyltransferase TrmB [Mycoplasmopsis equigenitalium]VEU69528.1 tRNA (guanine-N(7)-)-methyltransferase [Mycoplasmopsis californica]
MRLRNNPEAQTILENSGFLIKEFPIVLNKNDVIELGAGKGEMIAKLALANQNQMFYAVEKYHTVALQILKKIKEFNLKNLWIVCEDIDRLEEIFSGKVSLIWITFSDPWPKKRHAKRRLTHPYFLEKYEKLLLSDGIIKFKTDNDGLFEFSINSLKGYNCDILFMTKDLHTSDRSEGNIMTEYEKKWSSLNKNINYVEFKFKQEGEKNGNH